MRVSLASSQFRCGSPEKSNTTNESKSLRRVGNAPAIRSNSRTTVQIGNFAWRTNSHRRLKLSRPNTKQRPPPSSVKPHFFQREQGTPYTRIRSSTTEIPGPGNASSTSTTALALRVAHDQRLTIYHVLPSDVLGYCCVIEANPLVLRTDEGHAVAAVGIAIVLNDPLQVIPYRA